LSRQTKPVTRLWATSARHHSSSTCFFATPVFRRCGVNVQRTSTAGIRPAAPLPSDTEAHKANALVPRLPHGPLHRAQPPPNCAPDAKRQRFPRCVSPTPKKPLSMARWLCMHCLESVSPGTPGPAGRIRKRVGTRTTTAGVGPAAFLCAGVAAEGLLVWARL